MCGIVGWLGHGEELRTEGESALARLATRGPDGHALWIDPVTRVGLGNARLAILDPRPVASQPMARADLRLTHNGEIYNFIELREELEARGERFTTGSDTEVMLAAYRTWGEGMIERFNGMWAFALWDSARGALLLSRDRLGVKPMFVARGAACLHVASEIKALLGFSCLRWRPDLDLVHGFVTTGMTADGGNATFFKGIDRVPAASATWIDASTLVASERRFWTLAPDPGAAGLGMADAASRLDELLTDAVRIRLRSDVPVGITLSGGIDSSTIAAALPRLPEPQPPVRAFSVRWPSEARDEGPLIDRALAVTGLFGASVFAVPEELPAIADRLVWHQDEPFAHTAPFGQWLVYRLAASAGVHVVLEGQGADELFGGYHAAAFGGRFADLALRGSLPRLVAEFMAFRTRQGEGLGRAAGYAALAVAPRRLNSAVRTLRWRSGRFGGARMVAPSGEHAGQGSVLRRALRESLLATSLPALLRYADRSSMAHSVEVRLPFLDHRVVAFACGLQEELLVGEGETKRVLRTSLRRTMPDLADQPGKFGFTAPEGEWIRGPLRPWIGDLVAAADRRGLFPSGAAAAAWSATLAGRVPPQVAWRVAVAELWLRRFLDAGGRAP